MTLLKRTFGVMQCSKIIIFHILYIVAPLCPAFLKRADFQFESSVVETLSQKCQTVLAKLELPHFIETTFVQASIVGYSSRFTF